MLKIKMHAFREDLSEMVEHVRTKENLVLMRYGEPVVAVISVADLVELQELRVLYKTLRDRRAAA